MKKGNVHIGTSGWHYKHWRGTFYPADLKSAKQFEYYSRFFSTVEINNSFYKLPDTSTFAAWSGAAPDNFLFAVKGSRFITHAKKLKIEPGSISMFFEHTRGLKEKCGPILFQLPPLWKVNVERLDSFLKHLPADFRYAIEFRNPTWYTKEVYEILRKYDVMFCIYELDGHISPMEVTATGVYIRLHGPGAKYQGSYTNEVLAAWADRIKRWSRSGHDVYMYFDNDQEGYAAFNASSLLAMLKIKPAATIKAMEPAAKKRETNSVSTSAGQVVSAPAKESAGKKAVSASAKKSAGQAAPSRAKKSAGKTAVSSPAKKSAGKKAVSTTAKKSAGQAISTTAKESAGKKAISTRANKST